MSTAGVLLSKCAPEEDGRRGSYAERGRGGIMQTRTSFITLAECVGADEHPQTTLPMTGISTLVETYSPLQNYSLCDKSILM